MSLTKAWPLIVVLAVAFAPRGAFTQETTVTCLSSFDWVHVFFLRLREVGSNSCLGESLWQMNNSLIQNPCSVASYLVAACEDMGAPFPLLNRTWRSGITSLLAAVLVGPLPAGSEYGLKSDDPSSECNTVIYSMFSACATCQNGTFQKWVISNMHFFTQCLC